MPKIFVFTAGDRSAKQHLADSIEHSIPDETVFANFPEAHHEELERIREEGNGFYAWGALPGPGNHRNWEAMERDDRVLCTYDNAYRYTSRVLARYDNPDLAKSVWGEGEDGRTWRYMYFLTEPRKINRRVPELAHHLNAASSALRSSPTRSWPQSPQRTGRSRSSSLGCSTKGNKACGYSKRTRGTSISNKN